jgi:Trp operon repressor
LEDLPKRLAIFEALKKGVPQHDIARELGVGIATVTRGSLELQRGQIQKTSWWRNVSQKVGG